MKKFITKRQAEILNFIIDKYVKDGEPVGSMELVRYSCLNLSSATVRNEMAALEEAGLIDQPHTSAGRIPTSEGFKFYLNKKDFASGASPKVSEPMEKVMNASDNDENKGRELAKWLANESNDFAVVAMGDNQVFYAGFSNLANKREMRNDFDFFREFSDMMDGMDQHLFGILNQIHGVPQIFLGHDNPLSDEMSLVATDVKLGGQNVFVGLLGPVRMDYEENMSLLNYVKKQLESF